MAAEQAWAAVGRAELPIAPELCRPGFDAATAPRDAEGRRFVLVDGRAPHPPLVDRYERPHLECLTHVKRRRVTAERFVDKAGNARQRKTTKSAWVPAATAHEGSAKWHRGRADGLRARAAHVAACGVGHVEVSCGACGEVHDAPTYCGLVAWCPGCNERRSMRARQRFAKSFEAVQEHAELAGSFRKQQKGGGLRQKMLTLTVPHVDNAEASRPIFETHAAAPMPLETIAMWRETARGKVAERRVQVLYEAARVFTKRLQKHLRSPWRGETREIVGACWSRAFEWTLGADTMGHPHFHIWALEPWIPMVDEHRIESIIGGKARPTTPCKAQGDAPWSSRKRACAMCAARVERRTGMRTWWSAGLAAAGVELAPEDVRIDVREMTAHPMRAFREVRKPIGVNYQGRDLGPVERARAHVKSIEMRTAAGETIAYFENWNMGRLDEETLRLAGPAVIGGVARALEGRRMSQASKVVLLKKKSEPRGETIRVGFFGIADSYYGGECQSCKASQVDPRLVAEARAMVDAGDGVTILVPFLWKAPARLPEKGTRVVPWQQKIGAMVGAHAEAPDVMGPAPPLAEDAYAALVNRLRIEEAGGGAAVLARLTEVCTAIRELGPEVLAVYRRRKAVAAAPRTFRARMKSEAKRRRSA
jgi:hypothetical protein